MAIHLTHLVAALLCAFQGSEEAAPRRKPLEAEAGTPPVQFFVPGFEVRELPVTLTNINNVEYAEDGRLFAAGYDGRLHLLRDTDGDRLEDQVTTFYDHASDDYPLGIAVRPDGLYIMRRHAVVRHRETKSGGIPDLEEIVATGWQDPEVDKDPLMTHRRVDDALGLAIAPDGTIYVSMGAANYANGYLKTKSGQALLDLKKRRGCVLKIAPGTKTPEIVATGVRFLVCLQFNRNGDLFATDQEGATWLPNGNPFDELLHLEPGRHYGFPPRHPKYLPNVIDEPSVFDYAPQHESTCGFRFNERRPGREAFGPSSWEGDAIVTGESRGKLFRTKLVKTAAGYVARTELLASFSLLPVDLAISPQGDLLVCCHGGAPDWGSGPKGTGKLYKISYKDREIPQPLFAYPAGPGETAVVFDRVLDSKDWKDLGGKSRMEFGPYVTAGDQFERFRPGYQVVKDQMKAPRWELPILSAGLGSDGRAILLRTAPRVGAYRYALTLKGAGSGEADLGFDLTGVRAEWASEDGKDRWMGWLPHVDLAVARALTKESVEHDRLWERLEKAGTLIFHFQLDLKQMLQPAIQPGASLDYTYPSEQVSVSFHGGKGIRVESGKVEISSPNDQEVGFITTPDGSWIPLKISLPTGPGTGLSVSWHTDQDPRPRALPLRRVILPWARPGGDASEVTLIRPELQGGRWEEGKRLFYGDRLACGKCHTLRGDGGKIGPDLSNLVFRDYDSVMKDIVQPSAAINPDHIAYTIRLKSGDVLSGVVTASTSKTLVLGVVLGEPLTIERRAIDAMEPSKVSLMPENLLSGLGTEAIRDLMTFLLSEPPKITPQK